MKEFWEAMVAGLLCRVTRDRLGGLDVAVFNPREQQVRRITMRGDTPLADAQAQAVTMALSAATDEAEVAARRVTGQVKWFNVGKGYGFIRFQDDQEAFVHFSAILMDGFKQLSQDETVEFDLQRTGRGVQALDVIRTDAPDRDNFRELLLTRSERLAIAVVSGRLRVMGIAPDGRWHFLDQFERIHNLLYVFSQESAAYRAAVEELEFLINDPRVREQALHDFFERYPELILTNEYRRAHSKVILEVEGADDLIPDFVLEPVGQGRLCDLLELKLPTVRVEVLQERRYRFAAVVMEACAQLRTYRDYFEERTNRERFRARYGLDAFRPRLFVVIGRRGQVDPVEWRRIEGDLPGLTIRTYDDLLERAKYRLEKHGILQKRSI